MTLPASGAISSDDILTELGRSTGIALSSTDTDLLNMANLSAGAAITIPDDLYGKSYLGPLQGTYTVTVGDGGSAYGWQNSPTFGSISPSTYRAAAIQILYSTNGAASEDVKVVMNGIRAANYLTGIYFVDEDVWYASSTHATSSVTVWSFINSGSGGPWDSGDIGSSKTVRLYGI